MRKLKTVTEVKKTAEQIAIMLNGFSARDIQNVLFKVQEICDANYVLAIEQEAEADSHQSE